MCTPSAELEDPLDAARVGLFHLRLQLCTETVLVYAQQKTEVEKLNAFGRERFLQLRPGCQVFPSSFPLASAVPRRLRVAAGAADRVDRVSWARIAAFKCAQCVL